MHIVFDHRIFSVQRYGGVSRYYFELASRLARCAGQRTTILAFAHLNEYLRRNETERVVGRFIPRLPKTGALRICANEILTRAWLRSNSVDILHQTYFSDRAFAPVGARRVVTVYDMIHEMMPQYFPRARTLQKAKARAVERADHIICISDRTKTDLISILGVDPGKVSVVHLGCTRMRGEFASPRALVPRPYLLFVGERPGYKNFSGLLAALARMRLSREMMLVCFGGGPFRAEEIAQMNQSDLRKDVVQIDGEDERLASLYQHASALVYPSRYEGFGLPVLEAMAHGCPVICSRAGALPEIVGDAAELFDPTCIGSIAASVESVLNSAERQRHLRVRGLERAAVFSWDSCAQKTLEVYRSL